MDVMNWKRPEKDTGTDKVAISKNNDHFREYLDRIKYLLMRKMVHEKRLQDETNQTVLGNCSFWFKKQEDTGMSYLIFTKDPSLWDLDRLKEDLDALELAIAKTTMY